MVCVCSLVIVCVYQGVSCPTEGGPHTWGLTRVTLKVAAKKKNPHNHPGLLEVYDIYFRIRIRTKTHISDGCTSIGCYKLDWLEGIGNLHAVRREGFNKTIYGAKNGVQRTPVRFDMSSNLNFLVFLVESFLNLTILYALL